jgi:FkbM family methyltransferase
MMEWLDDCIRFASRMKVALQRMAGVELRHAYGAYHIHLPPGHLLPLYQRKHPQYDSFLPKLAGAMGHDGLVIDVGANVGDTLAAMAEVNPHLEYVCIEPDEQFFGFLKRNAEVVCEAFGGLRVTLVKALVGQGRHGVSLRGAASTKSMVEDGAGGLNSRTLDELIAHQRHGEVRLIKSDVDGYDFDVIQSGLAILREAQPILFFECQYFNVQQKQGFHDLLQTLEAQGYANWVVFDNYGALLMEASCIQPLNGLLDYVWAQSAGGSTRTIYYFDVLAFHDKDRDVIDSAVARNWSKFKKSAQP